jgi:hypothetical protein
VAIITRAARDIGKKIAYIGLVAQRRNVMRKEVPSHR